MRLLLLVAATLCALSVYSWAQEGEEHPHGDVDEAPEQAEEYAMPPLGAISFLMIPALDPEAAGYFYSEMFGWEIETGDGSEEMEDMVFWSDPHGAMGAFETVEEPTAAYSYIFYITVEDVTAKLAEITETGGTVFVEEMALPNDWGNIGMFTDPTGNVVGLWSP